jgi:hypothetical protein
MMVHYVPSSKSPSLIAGIKFKYLAYLYQPGPQHLNCIHDEEKEKKIRRRM